MRQRHPGVLDKQRTVDRDTAERIRRAVDETQAEARRIDRAALDRDAIELQPNQRRIACRIQRRARRVERAAGIDQRAVVQHDVAQFGRRLVAIDPHHAVGGVDRAAVGPGRIRIVRIAQHQRAVGDGDQTGIAECAAQFQRRAGGGRQRTISRVAPCRRSDVQRAAVGCLGQPVVLEADRADLQQLRSGVGIDGAGIVERNSRRTARRVGDAAEALDRTAERRCIGQRAAGQDDIADAGRTAVDDQLRPRQDDGEPGAGALVERQRAARDIKLAGHGHAIQRAALRDEALRGRGQRAAGDDARQIDLTGSDIERAGDVQRAGDRQNGIRCVQGKAGRTGGLASGNADGGALSNDSGVRAGVRRGNGRRGRCRRGGDLHHVGAVGFGVLVPRVVSVVSPKLTSSADTCNVRSVGCVPIPVPSNRRARRRIIHDENPISVVGGVRNLDAAQ